jgi:hypothetical protein
MNEPTHAIYLLDNWDGEGDMYWIFAYKKEEEFYSFESDSLILTHVGDKIVKEVSLSA